MLDEVIGRARSALASLGFTETEDTGIGPMGSRRVQFSSDRLVFEFASDRGRPAVGVGLRDDAAFGARAWAEILGIAEPPEETGTDGELAFFLAHLEAIDAVAAGDPSAGARLRDINWRHVKDRLHLDPDMPIPGTSEG